MSEEMPETFLELVQWAVGESSDVQGGPSTLVDVTGSYKSHKRNINSAWMFIQNLYPDWKFMYREGTHAWPTGSREQTLADLGLDRANAGRQRHGHWKENPAWSIYRQANRSDEQDLVFLPWDTFRVTYLRGEQDTPGQPRFVSIHPDMRLLLHPVPTAGYTLSYDYYRAAYSMGVDLPAGVTINDDQPDMPPEYRLVIVYYGLTKYGRKQAANEVYQDAHFEGQRLLKELERNQRPTRPQSNAVGLGGYP